VEYPRGGHCGALMFTDGTAVSPTASCVHGCRSSFARVHAAPMTSGPGGALGCQVTDPPVLDGAI